MKHPQIGNRLKNVTLFRQKRFQRKANSKVYIFQSTFHLIMINTDIHIDVTELKKKVKSNKKKRK